MDSQTVDFLTATAFGVANSLLGFSYQNTSDDKDLERFGTELQAYASAWSILLPSLHDPTIAPTQALLRLLERVVDGTTVVLKRLGEAVDVLARKHRRIDNIGHETICSLFKGQQQNRRHQILREFLNRQTVVLQRNQIIYATLTLNIVSVVVNAARSGLSLRPATLSTHNELHLLNEQQRARARIEELEALVSDPSVRATLWLEPLPDRPGSRRSIFSRLIREWVGFAQGTDAQRPNDGQMYMIMQDIRQLNHTVSNLQQRGEEQDVEINTLRDIVAQQREDINRYRIQIHSLGRELNSLQQNSISQREEFETLATEYEKVKSHHEKLVHENLILQNEVIHLRGQLGAQQNMSQPLSVHSRSASQERGGDQMDLAKATNVQARVKAEHKALQEDVQKRQRHVRTPSKSRYPPITYTDRARKSHRSDISQASRSRDVSASSSISERTYVGTDYDSDSKEWIHQSDGIRLGWMIRS